MHGHCDFSSILFFVSPLLLLFSSRSRFLHFSPSFLPSFSSPTLPLLLLLSISTPSLLSCFLLVSTPSLSLLLLFLSSPSLLLLHSFSPSLLLLFSFPSSWLHHLLLLPCIISPPPLFSLPVTPSSHLLLSSPPLIPSSHLLLSSPPLISSSHLLLSPPPLIPSSHPLLSSPPLISSSHPLRRPTCHPPPGRSSCATTS